MRNYSNYKGKRAMKAVCEYLAQVFPRIKFARNLKVMSGDIFTATDFPFVVEVKNVEAWRYAHFINQSGMFTATVKKFWEQVNRDCALHLERTKEVKIPWLIFTKNKEPYYFAIPTDFVHPRILLKAGMTATFLPVEHATVFTMPEPALMRKIILTSEPVSSIRKLNRKNSGK